jgi:hypothetical protein
MENILLALKFLSPDAHVVSIALYLLDLSSFIISIFLSAVAMLCGIYLLRFILYLLVYEFFNFLHTATTFFTQLQFIWIGSLTDLKGICHGIYDNLNW